MFRHTRQNRIRNIIEVSFALVSLVLFCMLLTLGCSDTNDKTESSDIYETPELHPDSEFYGTTHYIYEGGTVLAKIKADSTKSFNRQDSTVAWALEVFFYDSLGQTSSALVADSGLIRSKTGAYTIYGNLKADFYDSTGQITSHLVGDSGIIQEHTGLLHIYENVVVTGENDRMIETDYLRWNSAKDIIDTDAFVRFTRGNNDVITTYGLVADRGLTRVRLLNQVAGTVGHTAESKPGENPDGE